MAYVLAIETHPRQAEVLLNVVSLKADTRLTIARSVHAALSAIDREVPELVLASALLPPREESELLNRLRNLPRHTVPQVLVMPALISHAPPPSAPRRLLFRRPPHRKLAEPCDPATFADQISVYLKYADQRRYDTWEPQPQSLRFMPGSRGVDRRTALRFERVKSARARVNGKSADLVDMSVTGAQVIAPVVLQPGGSVQLLLSKDARAVDCEASVVWAGIEIVEPSGVAIYRAGVNFKDFDEDDFERFYFGQNWWRGSSRRY